MRRYAIPRHARRAPLQNDKAEANEGDVKNQSEPFRCVSVDFGTAYSSVAVADFPEGLVAETGRATAQRITVVGQFPDDEFARTKGHMRNQAPTELAYCLIPNFREEVAELKAGSVAAHEDERDAVETTGAAHQDEELDHSDISLNDADGHFFNMPLLEADEKPKPFRWGYSVQKVSSDPTASSDDNLVALSRFKLLLDRSDLTKAIRDELEDSLNKLRDAKVIYPASDEPADRDLSAQDLITDYLTGILRHAKAKLKPVTYKTVVVICVPTIWTQKACRVMQSAMATAMTRVGLGGVDIEHNCLEDVTIVSEQEAAAEYTITSSQTRFTANETVLVIDAGGGTVDAATYRISSTVPLRLEREVVPSQGALCGANFLNEDVNKLLNHALADQKHLNDEGQTIEGVVENAMISSFEYGIKRSFNVYDQSRDMLTIPIVGLKDQPEKGIKNRKVHIQRHVMKAIFLKRLNGISNIMEDQIRGAEDAGCPIKKVILVGGFADSPSLRDHLANKLKPSNEANEPEIHLEVPDANPTAVVSGGLLRAINNMKGNLLQRRARSSYGIKRLEPFDKKLQGHKEAPAADKLKSLDGKWYVTTILWIIEKDNEFAAKQESSLQSKYVFPCNRYNQPPVIGGELLYVSDKAVKLHYSISHAMNKDAEEVGSVSLDFNFLLDHNRADRLRPKRPASRRGPSRYEVHADFILRVVDRNLHCYLKYGEEEVRQCRINIASAFTAGA